MVGWHHQLDGHEFEQAPRVGGGQEAWRAAAHGVAKTEWLNWTDNDLRFTVQNCNYACTNLIQFLALRNLEKKTQNSNLKHYLTSIFSHPAFTSSHAATNSFPTTSMCCLGPTAYTFYLFHHALRLTMANFSYWFFRICVTSSKLTEIHGPSTGHHHTYFLLHWVVSVTKLSAPRGQDLCLVFTSPVADHRTWIS